MNKQPHKILVVIPERPFQEMVGELISMLNHQPILISNWYEAKSKFSGDKSIAVVVIDWEMTIKIWPNFIKEMDSIFSYPGKLVFAYLDDPEIRKHIELDEFSRFTQKPFQHEEFENRLSGCIEEYELAIKNCTCL